VANATDIVKKGTVSVTDEYAQESSATLSAETNFYGKALLGRTTGGYLAKMDDTASLVLAGVCDPKQGTQILPAGTAGDGTIDLWYHTPKFIELAISGVAITDLGKPVYALYDQTGTLDPSATTYANLIGVVKRLSYDSTGAVKTGQALVELCYGGVVDHGRVGATKVLAATGTQTLTKWDINKTIIITNTAAHSINLPAVADCPAGSRLTFVKTTSAAFAATLDANSTENIDGATTLATIDAQYDCATLVSTGSEWVVLSRDIA